MIRTKSYTQPLAALELSKAQLRSRLCITPSRLLRRVDTIQDGTACTRKGSRESSR